MKLRSLLPLLIVQLFLWLPAVRASVFQGNWQPIHFCKCICFDNYTILPLLLPEDPSKPCLSCTKQWCLDQKLGICKEASLGDANPDTATGREGDVDVRCFQRDSPRDQLTVTLFILIIVGLLIGAAAKGKMMEVGIDPADAWEASRKWWESLRLPSMPGSVRDATIIPMSRRGEYEHVCTTSDA
ncbi:hypothetical protein CALVIDRAFT_539969 [Calocera viscosa TUFC12733]|uniref:Transmembrane protein n=1 Tax=Calocera viscosa (strain TUFC12733) TaxID=1330018 RepID=A0A167JEM4_CALVF|nr:hypothetical protein CALVIDRAFT_539969 [Calocera viscosa TUFC12733]